LVGNLKRTTSFATVTLHHGNWLNDISDIRRLKKQLLAKADNYYNSTTTTTRSPEIKFQAQFREKPFLAYLKKRNPSKVNLEGFFAL